MTDQKYRAKLASIERLYAEIPVVQCKGLCSASCGLIPMMQVEEIRLRKAVGRPLPLVKDGSLECSHLTDAGRCGVYESRPLICRLWGQVDNPKMKCPHGCAPDLLTPEQSQSLIDRAIRLGGGLSKPVGRIVDAIVTQLRKNLTENPSATQRT